MNHNFSKVVLLNVIRKWRNDMKKALLSFALAGVLFLGTNSVFAAPSQKPMNNPPHIQKNQVYSPAQKHHVQKPPKHISHKPPKHHISHKPPKHYIAQQPYYYNNNGFALKVGNFFLSI